MSDTPRHDQSHELLAGAALGILDSADCGRILAEIDESAELARLLDQYRHTVAMLALTLSPRPMSAARSAQLRARLLARARNAAGPAAVSPPDARVFSGPPRWRAVVSGVTGWSVAAGLGGLLMIHHGLHQDLGYGWVAGGILAVILVVVGIYARILRTRASALQERLLSLERSERWGNEVLEKTPSAGEE